MNAIDRLRAWIRDYGHENQPQFIADLTEVIDRLCHSDDGEAIDEAWLRSVGFEPVWGAAEWYRQMGRLRTFPGEGERQWEIAEDFGFNTIPNRLRPKTRGDLRRLAAFLGIELKETP